MASSRAAFWLSEADTCTCRLMLALLVLCLLGQSAGAGHIDAAMPVSAQTSTYVFVTAQSTMVQTGGIAGVHETHSISGQFQLWIDPDAGNASFPHVQANLTGKSGFLPSDDLNVFINMTGLVGAISSDDTITFKGKTAYGTKSDVVLKLIFDGDLVRLTGTTVPPAGSADFFIFNLDAVVRKKYDGGTGEPNRPYLIRTARQMNAIGEDPQ